MTKQEQALVEAERKFPVASSEVLSAQHSALENEEEARKYREELNFVKERIEIAQVSANKALDDGNTAMEEAFKFEAEHVPEVGRRRNEVGELTEQLCQQVSSAAVGSEELADCTPSSNCIMQKRNPWMKR